MQLVGRGKRRGSPRHSPGPGWLAGPVAVAAMLFPMALAVGVVPAGGAPARAQSASGDWVAQSAYGLQLSVPTSWATEYFENCPHHGAGTLLIGTPSTDDNCAHSSQSTNIVTVQLEKSEAVPAVREKTFVVHGLEVTSYTVGATLNWDVRHKSVVISATGPGSLAVLRTLTAATARAHAAPGILKGSEFVESLEQTPVTGPVTLTRLAAPSQPSPAVQAYDGQFSATLSPGTYRVTGHAGNAPCPRITTMVESGQVRSMASIDCQGY